MRLYIALIFIFCGPGKGYAQLCQGSLGDPLVKIDFGQGNNPGAPLAAAATGYNYIAGDCPNDGNYTVINTTSNCFGSTWHNLTTDHTNNGQGYFMLVNASFSPSAFYLDTVRGLCANTTYEFAAWVLNIIKPSSCNNASIQPNLTFRIELVDGTVLQTYNTGNIPPTSSPAWNQYGSFFTTPAGVTTVVLRLINNAPGGCGNDLALDDITFRPCGPLITPSIVGVTGSTAIVCQGTAGSFQLKGTVSAGFSNPVYQWQQFNAGSWTDIPGATTNTITRNIPSNAPAGDLLYRLTVAESGNLGTPACRVSSLPLTIRIAALPVVTITGSNSVCEKESITLTASGASTYTWTGPAGNSTDATWIIPNSNPAQSGSYQVTGTNADGCSAGSSFPVTVNPAPQTTVVFTDTTICSGQQVTLLSATSQPVTYAWTPSTGLTQDNVANPVASPAVDTRYRLVTTNPAGCTDTAFVQVFLTSLPKVDAGPDKFLVQGQQVQLQGSITGKYTRFSWSPLSNITNASTLTPMVSPPADEVYFLHVVSACGIVYDSVAVKFYNGLYIPNIFTPNGDGINDSWNIPALGAYPGFNLQVYNRLGEKVYESSNLFRPWDGKYKGKLQETGTYIWQLMLPGEKIVRKGTLLLIR